MADQKVRVPDAHRAPYELIAQLPEDAAAGLFAALTEQPLVLDTDELYERVVSRDALPPADAEAVVDAFVSLALFVASDHRDIEEVAATLASDPALELEAASREALRARLAEGLRAGSIRGTAKVINLVWGDRAIYSEAETFSEIRPVFDEDLLADPMAAMVLHTLRISYFQDGDLLSFHVTLNTTEVEALRGVLDRAINKQATLTRLISSGGVHLYEPGE
jgi:hypothetical protein